MKNIIYKLFAIAAMMLLSFGLFAQNPPHPNGGGGPTGGNTPVGGGAPIDGGLTLMIIMGAAYGSKKLFTAKKLTE
ncbi:MAG: hypothetical protein K9G76_05980 [Bacteroidales bacterium]|nr:hypothetical protein [Bacteroidales bacterium]MCF8402423.1 hypothetical protein [Bacteroidales bacterium]